MNTIINHYFELEKHSSEAHLQNIKKHIPANEYLKRFDWLFISPLYMTGAIIGLIEKLLSDGNNDSQKVSEIFINTFHDISRSASFIRGYCERAKHVNLFTRSIEHSMILAYQRDYEGAIKTLLPIIEGILSQYLIQDKGYEMKNVNFPSLKESLTLLENDIVKKQNNYFKNYTTLNGQTITFTDAQVEILTNIEKEHYSIWFTFFRDFVNDSLYKSSRNGNIEGLLNRHSALHEFNDKTMNYSIENYIKLYNSIHFLVWTFLRYESKSLLNEIEQQKYVSTYMAYEKIIFYSKLSLEAKAELDDRYKKYVEPKETIFVNLLKKIVSMKMKR